MLTNPLTLKIESMIRNKSRNEHEFRNTLTNFTHDMLRDIVYILFIKNIFY